MSTDDDVSYRRLLDEYRQRDNYDSVFRSTLDDLSNKVDFSWMQSCIALGPGSGEHEIAFIRRLLPNLQQLIAVEPDHESVKALRTNFHTSELSGLQTTVVEAPVQTWDGVEQPVDGVLCFNVIYHVEGEDRTQLLHRLKTQYLKPGGIIILIENGSPFTSGYIRLMHQLGYAQDNWYVDIEKDVLAAGFQLDLLHDIVSTRDLTNPSDGVLKYIELLFNKSVSAEQIRTYIADIYSDSAADVKHIVRKIAVFRNNSQK